MDFFGVCVVYSVRDVIRLSSPRQSCSSLQLTATTLASEQVFGVYSGWKSVDNYDSCASVFVVKFIGFMSLTSYFDIMYSY